MAHTKPTFSWLIQRPICYLGFGFGTGLAPVAPGTFGTLPALPIAYILIHLGVSGMGLALLCLPLFLLGIYICEYTERTLGIADYGGIVWDEIVAMMFILAFVPFTWTWWLLAFAVFRLLDASKPFPIKWFDQRIHGGFGIMLDDMLAAVMSVAILEVAQRFFHF